MDAELDSAFFQAAMRTIDKISEDPMRDFEKAMSENKPEKLRWAIERVGNLSRKAITLCGMIEDVKKRRDCRSEFTRRHAHLTLETMDPKLKSRCRCK